MNTRYSDGSETERGVPKSISEKAYKQKYATRDENGVWWYKVHAPAVAPTTGDIAPRE